MDAARVAKNTGFLYAHIAVNIIIALYSTRLVLDALGVEDFGIYNLVSGVIGMLAFLNSSMAEATQRFMAIAHGEENPEKQNSIFNVSLVLHFIIAIVVIVILEVAGYYLFRSVLEIPENRVSVAKLVYQFMLVSTFFTITKVPYDAVLNAHENMIVVALLGILHAIIKLGIAIYLTYTTFDQLIVFGLLMAALSIAMVIISYIYCHIKYEEVKINIRKTFDKKLFREMGSFASWSFLIQSAFVITMQGTTIILNSFFGVIINAAQGIANQVSNQLQNFTNTMQKALNPVIVKREGKKDREKMLEASLFGNKISFFVISLMSVPFFIEMPLILGLWLKDVPDFAVIFCRLQLIRLIISSFTQSFFIAIGAIGKIKKFSIWESLIFFSVLPTSFVAYKLGASPEAIYINLIFLSIALSISRVYFLNRLGGLSVKLFMKNIIARCATVLIITAAIAVLLRFMMNESILRLLIVLAVSSVTFVVLMFLIGFNNTEKGQIKSLALSFLKK